jgi:hypothetical protein
MAKEPDLIEHIRAIGAVTDHHRNERTRQRVARAGFDAVFGLGGRLANLVECEICGLLDDQSPCGDHEGVS